MDETWTIGRLLTWTTDYLKRHGAESPRLDAEVLLAHARRCQRIELYTCFEEVASATLRDVFRDLVKKRARGTPVAYLVGHREFYSKPFFVTPAVLIPRPETEFVLVALFDQIRGNREGVDDEAARNIDPLHQPAAPVRESAPSQSPLTIADVGTGSGVLAVCAASHLPAASVTAVDVSQEAIDIARRNAEWHDVSDRVQFRVSDVLTDLPPEERFDYIISNPPYVAEFERAVLPRDVLDFEPPSAIFAGPEGLDVLNRLIDESAYRLNPGGYLIAEFSPPQKNRLIQRGQQAGLYPVRTLDDLSRQPRVIVLQRPARSSSGVAGKE